METRTIKQHKMTPIKINIDGTDYELRAIPNRPKVVEKDWEIQCFTDGKRNWWINKNNLFANMPFESGVYESILLQNKEMKIWQVKRTSDQEILTVADETEQGKIKSFRIGGKDDKFMYACTGSNTWNINDLKKLPTPTKRFEWTDENVRGLLEKITAYRSNEHWEKEIANYKASKKNTNDGKGVVGCKTEAERWDEIVGGKAKWPHNESGVKNFGMIIPKQASKQLYTIDDLEDAFNAATVVVNIMEASSRNYVAPFYAKYPKFQDYKKTLEK